MHVIFDNKSVLKMEFLEKNKFVTMRMMSKLLPFHL